MLEKGYATRSTDMQAIPQHHLLKSNMIMLIRIDNTWVETEETHTK